MQNQERDKRRAWRLACTDAAATELRDAAATAGAENGEPLRECERRKMLHAATMRATRMLGSLHPGDLPTTLRRTVELYHQPPSGQAHG